MNKQITLEQAVERVHDGMTIMFGGFLGNGSPTQIIDAIVAKGVKDLTIISNDTGYDDYAHGKLVSNHQVKRAIVSHTGTNKQTAIQKNEGTLIVEYVPQGTLAERIRAYGAGLGGILTPTGLGTIMAEGKEIITVDGKEYLLEKPLKADIAFLRANIVDEFGNMVFLGTTNNFNPLMATAADYVVVEAEKLVKVGEIKPECVHASGIYVNAIYVEQ
ncbi:MAG: CoA transferase subunit A [Bacteroidales bacterium]|nr:CoA transferase subunit A [Bacteroidales bacterium]